MEKPKIVDEKALECAEILKEYCKRHNGCAEGCAFYQADATYDVCRLDENNPEQWKLNEDDRNE